MTAAFASAPCGPVPTPIAQGVQTGVRETLRTGNLRGKPAIIVHGRADALIPVNFNSRPYFGLNKQSSKARKVKLTYIEVTNAQHFDSLHRQSRLFPGYDSAYIPLHYYFIKAMDAMYAQPDAKRAAAAVTGRADGPARRYAGSGAGDHPANVPPIVSAPSAGNQITFSGNTVTVPD